MSCSMGSKTADLRLMIGIKVATEMGTPCCMYKTASMYNSFDKVPNQKRWLQIQLALTIGTACFSFLEVIQMMTLKDQYARILNLVEIVYLAMNVFFIIDVFKRIMNDVVN